MMTTSTSELNPWFRAGVLLALMEYRARLVRPGHIRPVAAQQPVHRERTNSSLQTRTCPSKQGRLRPG